MLQSEAGYINARPHLPDRGNLLQCTAGPYIRVKMRKTRSEYNESGSHSIADMRADIAFCRSVPLATSREQHGWCLKRPVSAAICFWNRSQPSHSQP